MNVHGEHYISYRIKSRIRLILLAIGTIALITLVIFLFVTLIQRNQSQKVAYISSSSESKNSSELTVSSTASSSTAASSSSISSSQLDDWRLVLVNSTNKMPSSFQLHLVRDFGDIELDQRIVQSYTEMNKAARLENISLWISVAYRSPQLQSKLLNNEIADNLQAGLSSSEATEKAKKAVALPNYSEHHTGLAMDLNGVKTDFDKTPAFAWLQKHAAEYGFILRYPKDKESITKIMYEPWHYRYVGPEHAKKMNQLNMCLEEYVAYLKKNP